MTTKEQIIQEIEQIPEPLHRRGTKLCALPKIALTTKNTE